MINRSVPLTRILAQFAERYLSGPSLWLRARRELRVGEYGIHLARQLADPNRVSVDVGANRGIFSYWLSKGSAATISVEPHPACQAYLERALGKDIELIRGGCSDSAGTATLIVPLNSGVANTYRSSLAVLDEAGDFESIEVEIFRLDDLNVGDVGFFKIDVEGHEKQVLLGALELIERCRPVVLIEAEERHSAGTVDFVRRFFAERDYAGFFIVQREVRPVEEFELALHQGVGPVAGEFDNNYANNFLFVPAENQSALRFLSGVPPS